MTTMLSDEDVKKIAKLSYLELNGEELARFGSELSSILDYINQLKQIDVAGVEASSHVHGSTNVMREDKVEPSFSIEELFKISPDHSGRFIKVPIVIEEA